MEHGVSPAVPGGRREVNCLVLIYATIMRESELIIGKLREKI